MWGFAFVLYGSCACLAVVEVRVGARSLES